MRFWLSRSRTTRASSRSRITFAPRHPRAWNTTPRHRAILASELDRVKGKKLRAQFDGASTLTVDVAQIRTTADKFKTQGKKVVSCIGLSTAPADPIESSCHACSDGFSPPSRQGRQFWLITRLSPLSLRTHPQIFGDLGGLAAKNNRRLEPSRHSDGGRLRGVDDFARDRDGGACGVRFASAGDE